MKKDPKREPPGSLFVCCYLCEKLVLISYFWGKLVYNNSISKI